MSEIILSEQAKGMRVRIAAAFLAIYLIWGTTFLGIRFAVETIPPFLMAGLRFFVAGGAMLVFLLARGRPFPSLLHWRSAAIVGGLMLAGGIGLLSFAEKRIPSGLAALVVATIPIWMTVIEWLRFRGKRPSLQAFAGLGLGFAGAILLFEPALSARGGYDLPGMAIVLVGAMFFAVGSLYSRRAPQPEDTLMSTACEMLAGGAWLLIISLLSGELAHFSVTAVSTRSVLALAYLVVFGSIIAYTAFLWLLKIVDPVKVGTNFYVNPVVAIFVGWLAANETVTLQAVAAAGVIFLGVAVINLKPPE